MFVSKTFLNLKEESATLRAENAAIRAENARLLYKLGEFEREAAQKRLGDKLLIQQYENLFAYDGTGQLGGGKQADTLQTGGAGDEE